jgi:hypothetical protein
LVKDRSWETGRAVWLHVSARPELGRSVKQPEKDESTEGRRGPAHKGKELAPEANLFSFSRKPTARAGSDDLMV